MPARSKKTASEAPLDLCILSYDLSKTPQPPIRAAAAAGQALHDVRAGAPLPLPSIAAAAEPRRRRALSGGGGRGRARRLPRARRQRGRGLRCGRLHGRAPGAALREVDALVAADGIHARPRDTVSARFCSFESRSIRKRKRR